MALPVTVTELPSPVVAPLVLAAALPPSPPWHRPMPEPPSPPSAVAWLVAMPAVLVALLVAAARPRPAGGTLPFLSDPCCRASPPRGRCFDVHCVLLTDLIGNSRRCLPCRPRPCMRHPPLPA